ncbi:MAG: DUF1573 domain-containing protein [Prevotella sp.]|jgi:hypothetical protein|nr:DUF1573 domain-containing protein [Prevotella sp.]
MQTKPLIVSMLALALLFGCKETGKERLTRLVSEWQGKEIVFPDNLIFTRYVVDTVDYQLPESDYKVLVYVDSLGCTGCKLQLYKWKELIAYTDSATGGTVPFLFFFHAKDLKEINHLLKVDKFDLPVCMDKDDRLNKLNKFPSDIMFQTFLLDKDNKVAVIGNPVHNLAIRDLYVKQITGKDMPDNNQTKTIAEAEITEVNMGRFPKAEQRKALFNITNKGEYPLVILGTTATCGCAKAQFDKHPAGKGETLQVSIEMSPKDSGFFSETITVKCNTDKPIKLIIKGQAL